MMLVASTGLLTGTGRVFLSYGFYLVQFIQNQHYGRMSKSGAIYLKVGTHV